MGRMRWSVWQRGAFAAVCACVLLITAGRPVNRAYALDTDRIELTVVVKPDHLCMDQSARIVFMVDLIQSPDSLGALTPLVVRALPSLGEISPRRWSFPPQAGTNIGYMDYKAQKEGHDEISFAADYKGETVLLPDVSIEVYKCQYKVKVNGNQVWNHSGNQTNTNINQFYEGEGDFDLILDKSSKNQDILISGSGTVKWEMMMLWTSPAGNCTFEPNFKGEATFRVRGSVNKDDNIQMDIVFEKGQHGGGLTTCQVQGKQVNGLPMPPTAFTLFSQNLMGMTFSLFGEDKTFVGAPLAAPPWNVNEDVYVSVREASK